MKTCSSGASMRFITAWSGSGVVNTGRFHVIDSLIKMALSQAPLYLLDAPLPVFLWVGAVTAITGLLTHCNVETRTALFDPIFATPKLHRWHHSKTLKEGNSNYCENIMVWDHVFGTYLNPAKASPDRLGISGKVASDFLGQIVQPFSRKGARQILAVRLRPKRREALLAKDQKRAPRTTLCVGFPHWCARLHPPRCLTFPPPRYGDVPRRRKDGSPRR